jgi:hypothetical protein
MAQNSCMNAVCPSITPRSFVEFSAMCPHGRHDQRTRDEPTTREGYSVRCAMDRGGRRRSAPAGAPLPSG